MFLPVEIALVKKKKMKEKLLTVLENSRNYTMAVADAMPENAYGFKLVADSWKYGDLLTHIGYGIRWWDSNSIKNTKTDWEPPKTPDSKKAVIKYIGESYDTLKKTLENSKISDEVIYGFNATIDHITHHRAQAVLFLRSNNIAPPEYIY
jgi:hypothetical protein